MVNDLIHRRGLDLVILTFFFAQKVILTEAMLNGDRLTSQAKKLKFDSLISVDSRGLSGGIPILWNSFNLDINALGLTE